MREVIRYVFRLEERLVARIASFATVRRSSLYATGFFLVTVVAGMIRFLTLPNALAEGEVAGDFRGFYHAGELVRLGQSAHLYDRLEEALRGQSLEPPHMYPPLVAALYAPLSALPYGTALVAFWIVSVALWYAISSILSREFHLASPPRGFWQLVRFAPIVYSLAYGQMTVLWALALALFVVSLRRGRDVMAGLFLGLFALKPQSIVGIFCFVLLQRRWKAAAATLVSGGAVTALGFVLFEEPSRHFASLSTATFVWSRTAAASPWNQVGFFRLGTNLLDPWSPALGTVAGVALMLAALSCLVLVSARRHPVGSRDWDFALAMVIALSLGLSPYMFHYDAGLLAIAFALVAHRLARAPSSPNEPYLSDPRASAAIFVMCLSMALSPGLFVRVHELTGWSAWVQPSTLCLAYFVWAVFRARLEPGDRAEGV